MEKVTLHNIISRCKDNKDFNEFNVILTITNYIKHKDTDIHSIEFTDDAILITFKHGINYLNLNFYSDNTITVTLPFSGMFIVNNCDYNIQYDEIKEMLK